jgi:hypothetical protein
MTLNAHHDPMTDAQRDESLCREADIPDKSAELLTRQGAEDMISDLRQKEHAASPRQSSPVVVDLSSPKTY